MREDAFVLFTCDDPSQHRWNCRPHLFLACQLSRQMPAPRRPLLRLRLLHPLHLSHPSFQHYHLFRPAPLLLLRRVQPVQILVSKTHTGQRRTHRWSTGSLQHNAQVDHPSTFADQNATLRMATRAAAC